MGKINGCLKCLFIFFNVLFAIIGCVLIYGAVKSAAISNQMSSVGAPGVGWVWVFAIGVLAISCLGIYAGCAEKDIVLKVFAGFMGVGLIIMLIFGIIVVVMRNKIKTKFTSTTSEYAKPLMEDEGFRGVLEGFQQSAQCCGVSSASDWGNEIPDSCACTTSNYFGGGCTARPGGATGPNQIYAQTCGDTLFIFFDLFFKIAMGFFFGFAVTALLGLLVSLLMIHQIKRHDSSGGASIAMKGF
ncbi:CD63 antigen-like [Scomber japonicus]|uniref:CD63 antigen-like n=1 Tax=Scomber japonicus TaxID=13676 RepID=UPI002305D940|nr:CD63 antigen-like [Scomber japonicus]